MEELLTHRIIATVRYDFNRGILKTDDAETLGIFDHTTNSLEVPAGEGSWLRVSPPRRAWASSTSARAPITCCSC